MTRLPHPAPLETLCLSPMRTAPPGPTALVGSNPTNGGSCNNGAVVPNQPLPPSVPPSQTTTTASGLTYSRVTQTYNGTVTVRNTTGSAVKGPVEILFTGIPSGVTLINATSSVAGTPYLTV